LEILLFITENINIKYYYIMFEIKNFIVYRNCLIIYDQSVQHSTNAIPIGLLFSPIM